MPHGVKLIITITLSLSNWYNHCICHELGEAITNEYKSFYLFTPRFTFLWFHIFNICSTTKPQKSYNKCHPANSCCSVLNVNIKHISLCSTASIVDFEKVNTSWEPHLSFSGKLFWQVFEKFCKYLFYN